MNSKQHLGTCAKMGIFSNIAASFKKKMRINRKENRKENKKNPTTSTSSPSAGASSQKREKKNSYNSLLKFPREAEAAYAFHPGVTALHRACFQARPSSVIISLTITSADNIQGFSADVPDFLGRLPLHIITIRICDGTMSISDGLLVVDILSAVYIQGIFAKDDFGDTPIDIVHNAKLILRTNANAGTKAEYKIRMRKLDVVMICLRRICINHYLQQKQTWESNNNDNNKKKTTTKEERILFYGYSDCSSLAVQNGERSVSGSSDGACTHTSTDDEFFL